MTSSEKEFATLVDLVPFVKRKLDLGFNEDDIVEQLVSKGTTKAKAKDAVKKAVDFIQTHPDKAIKLANANRVSHGVPMMILGGLLFLPGLAVTAFGYYAAEPGTLYAVWVGPMLVGAVSFIIGFFRFLG